jgi:hypothetical protein
VVEKKLDRSKLLNQKEILAKKKFVADVNGALLPGD